MVPIRLGSVAILKMMREAGLNDTLTALILVYVAQGLPMSIFILSEFVQQIPKDLRDAARCDGVPETRIFFEVIAPLLRPAIATVAVFTIVPIWNDLWFPLILTSSELDPHDHARRAAVPRPVHHRLELGAGGAVDGDPAGRRHLRRLLAATDQRPHRRRGQVGARPRMARLRIEQLNKSYGPARVLSDIELSIEDGEFVVLVGPSGCGKSTLLRMIAGLDAPTSGDIFIGDRLVNALAPAERKIAMVFQSYALYPHMDVRKNMTFGLKFTGVAPAERERRVAEAARMLRLEELLGRYPRDLSGGQRQRVAIGRAIVREPDVFLFDEPLSNLDAALRVSTRVEIARLHRLLGATMVYVTHDQIEAMTLADRIVVMNLGPHRADRQAARSLLHAGQPVRRRLHRLAGDEFLSGDRRAGRGRGGARSKASSIAPFALPARIADAAARGSPSAFVRSISRCGAPGAFSATGSVELVERLGEASYAHVRRADDKMMIAEIRGRDTPSPGQTVTFSAPADDIHVFDEGGRRV